MPPSNRKLNVNFKTGMDIVIRARIEEVRTRNVCRIKKVPIDALDKGKIDLI